MKIKVLSRSAEECTRERSCDLARVYRNPDPALHPFERAREYTRSLNAAKLDRVRRRGPVPVPAPAPQAAAPPAVVCAAAVPSAHTTRRRCSRNRSCAR